MGAWTVHGWVVAITALAVIATVALHYEGLVWLARHFRRKSRDSPPRRRVVLLVICALLTLHVVEIWMFGAAYWGALLLEGSGSVSGAQPLSFLDAVYLSAVTYTTVGFGDLAPVGPIRFLAGSEALTGLMMITWSASFTYLEMSRHWGDD